MQNYIKQAFLIFALLSTCALSSAATSGNIGIYMGNNVNEYTVIQPMIPGCPTSPVIHYPRGLYQDLSCYKPEQGPITLWRVAEDLVKVCDVTLDPSHPLSLVAATIIDGTYSCEYPAQPLTPKKNN